MEKKRIIHELGPCGRKMLRVMKLTFFLLSISFLSLYAADSYSQDTRVTVSANQLRLEDFLEKIENQSEFRFFYTGKINVDKRISASFRNKTITEIMDEVSRIVDIQYAVMGRQVVLAPREEVVVLLQQEKTITGRVVDENGEPIPGASIVVKGTTTGTITDMDGNFTLTGVPEDAVLQFSFVGMRTQEVSVGNKTRLDVEMEQETIGLEEVVAIGYGTMKRSDLTGAVASIDAVNLKKGIVFSTEQLLQGKVAGLSVIQSSGDPTSTASMRLRGGTSLSASNSPLIVADGVPGVDFNTIQPSEIVSIDVLKDASASAIYGSRGANGVIIVTTNSSHKGKSIKYDGYYAIGEVAKNIDLLSANQWREYIKDNNPPGVIDYGSDTDWQKSIQQTSIIHSQALSFVNNGDDGGHRVSLSYLNNEGVIKTSSLERIGASLSGYQYAFNKRLRLEAGMHSTFDESSQIDYGVFRRTYNLNPTIPVRDKNGEFTEIVGSFYENPVEMLADRTSDDTQKRILGYGKAELEILTGLKGVVNASYEYNSTQNRFYLPTYAVVEGRTENGRAERALSDFSNEQLETYLTYDVKINNQHKLNLLAGYSYLEHTYEGFGAQRRGFDTDEFLYNNLGAGQDVRADDVSSFKGESKLISFYGRANYNYLNKYLLTASLRRDGSSKFGVNNKWGLFPSASLAWRISEESFMRSSSEWLNYLKLRVGYGITGNQDGIGEYKSLSLISAGGAPYYDAEDGSWKQSYGIIQNDNPDLKWESTAQLNIGVDFSLFNIINGAFEIYHKMTTDLLYTYEVPQPPYLYGTILANVGDLSNKGYELTVNANLLKKKVLNWNATLTFSHNIQEIDKLSNQVYQTEAIYSGSLHGLPGMSGQYAQIIKEGYAPGTFWGPKSLGLNQNGEIIYENDGEPQYLGNAQPKYNVGFSMDIRYKKFDFQVSSYGMFGQKVLNGTAMVLSDPGRLPMNNVTVSSRKKGITSHAEYSSYWIEDASFLRLQNATVGYNFNTKKFGIDRCRIYATGENLFVLTGYNGIDPEVNIDGLDNPGMDVYDYYPKPRTILFGVNLSF